jgi:hypothetical protein
LTLKRSPSGAVRSIPTETNASLRLQQARLGAAPQLPDLIDQFHAAERLVAPSTRSVDKRQPSIREPRPRGSVDGAREVDRLKVR